MKRISKILLTSFSLISIMGMMACSVYEANDEDEEYDTTVDTDDITIDDTVTTKYSSYDTSTQSKFEALNVHDPKLFQNDDGTYYVYSTDASCGNVEKTGISIRYSTDLVNWTCYNHSALRGNWDTDFLAWEGFSASSSEVKHSNSSYTAVSWAPTVIKQNGLYYMYHGVNADVPLSGSTKTQWGSSICLAIASSAKGPFYPCDYISSYSGSDSDILAIQSILNNLGVTYSQSFLSRYTANYSKTLGTGSLDGTALAVADNTQSDNKRFGCIDPEFVYDVATGSLMEYDIEGNKCYALTYGSWMNGIALIYVDALSLKPIYYDYSNGSSRSITVNNVSYAPGDELEVPLDQANYEYYGEAYKGNYGCLGYRIAGGYGAGYEGSQVIYNSNTGYYYVFVSMGDLSNEYRVGVGRSSSINGEYVDAGGQSMLLTSSNYSEYHAIGSKIIGAQCLDGEYGWRCPGGQSILRTSDGRIIFACHTRTNFLPTYMFWLQCRQMFFTSDGWPVLNQNEYYKSDDFTENLSALSLSTIAGTYDSILTVRGSDTSTFTNYEGGSGSYCTADANETDSKKLVIAEDGTVSGNYTGSLSLASDGYTVTLTLDNYGTFTGYALYAVDWARKDSDATRKTVTLTLIDSNSGDTASGEYFWANKHNY